MAGRKHGEAARIHIGVGGWNFAPWRDNFYPAGLAHTRELEYASRHLTAIEINSTYHGTQKRRRLPIGVMPRRTALCFP